VCAVDDSPEAANALRVAARLSGESGLRLVAAHVARDASTRTGGRVDVQRGGHRLLDRVLAGGELVGALDTRVEVGDRAAELSRVAAEEAASVIVMGARGRRWSRRPRMSRLTVELAATARCPVVVVLPRPRP